GNIEGFLTKIERKSNNFFHYKLDLEFEKKFYRSIDDILERDDGLLWLATSAGLILFNPETGGYKIIENKEDRHNRSIKYNYITCLLLDKEEHLWCGTVMNGLMECDKNGKALSRYPGTGDDTSGFSGEEVQSLIIDSEQNIWIGTNLGLNLIPPGSRKFKQYLAGRAVHSIYEDNQKRIWIGTKNSGLFLWDKTGDIFTDFFKNDILTGKTVYSIIGDENDNLWLGLDIGILFLNFHEKKQRLFTQEDGISFYQFINNAAARGKDGTIYMGSRKGLNIFDPDDIIIDTIAPGIVLTDFKIFEEPVEIGGDSPLKENINIAEKIELPYWQNDIRIKYASIHFSQPGRNEYAYYLENYDEDWRFVGKNRGAAYTNISPGEYTFKVKAVNKDGFWSKQARELKIIISPPIWLTWWAYSFYLIVLAVIYFAIRKYEVNRLNLKHSLSLKEAEAMKLLELDKLKSRFFINISHEFRTPLALILGPLEKLMNKHGAADQNHLYEMMNRNAKRLLRLINQLLEFSKIEAGKMRLSVSSSDLVKFIKPIVFSFQSLAERQNKEFEFHFEPVSIPAYFDPDKLEKVVYNLLSNAFKYTGENGVIKFYVKKTHNDNSKKIILPGGDFAVIIVEDNGIGIKKEDLETVFEIFKQGNNLPTNNEEAGTGVGLALTKELVELHKGS
ncbi:hypothetical protein KKC87_04020, partial [Patescibacteria group bacterium]|nr:hypothetical protein [Patescibacteria group bacterium]